MNKKVVLVLAIVVFIVILILAGVLLNLTASQNNTPINQKNSSENTTSVKTNIIKGTATNFEEEVLKSDQVVLIDFYADWCGPCKKLSPLVEEVASENPDIKVVKIDVDQEQDLANQYQIMSIPTLVVFQNGEELDRRIGLISKSEIVDFIK